MWDPNKPNDAKSGIQYLLYLLLVQYQCESFMDIVDSILLPQIQQCSTSVTYRESEKEGDWECDPRLC